MRKITNDELKEILYKHREWLQKRGSGERANLVHVDLNGANLRNVNLTGANLRDVDLSEANLNGANLRNADLSYANLSDADLRGADLRGADLRFAELIGADLRGAKVDLATWPLWCGSFGVKVDARIARQLTYHLCRIDCDDEEFLGVREAVKDFANKFHRVDECGRIE